MKISPPIPILRLFDFAKAKEFYVDFLGFTIDWEHRFHETAPVYLQVSFGDCVIHFSEHHGSGSPGGALRIGIVDGDIDEFMKSLRDKKYPYCNPGSAEIQPWGSREITITDPFGNRLTFAQEPA